LYKGDPERAYLLNTQAMPRRTCSLFASTWAQITRPTVRP
jgi:hypothetical protein